MSDNYNEFDYGNDPRRDDSGNSERNGYAYQNVSSFDKPKTMAWSVASLVLGIISIICCCLGWTGIIFGALALVFAFVSRKTLGYFDGMAIAGLVTGIFGLIFGALILFVLSSNEFWESFYIEFEKQFNEMYPDAGTGM